MSLRPAPRRAAGFTLIEVLVVMIMLAMIGGVLFQALERAYRLQERFGLTLFNVQQGQMVSDWYRQTVQGLHPDYPDGANVFQGKAQELTGLSTNPLNDDFGMPTPISWKLRTQPENGTTDLVYVDKKQETPVLSWRAKEARFVYLDDRQTPHDTWPPRLGLFPQLPTQIQIQTTDAGESVALVASPMGPTTAPLRIKDLLGIPQ